jgi:hypothetical protein
MLKMDIKGGGNSAGVHSSRINALGNVSLSENIHDRLDFRFGGKCRQHLGENRKSARFGGVQSSDVPISDEAVKYQGCRER